MKTYKTRVEIDLKYLMTVICLNIKFMFRRRINKAPENLFWKQIKTTAAGVCEMQQRSTLICFTHWQSKILIQIQNDIKKTAKINISEVRRTNGQKDR